MGFQASLLAFVWAIGKGFPKSNWTGGGETVTGLVNGNFVIFSILFTLSSAAKSHVT